MHTHDVPSFLRVRRKFPFYRFGMGCLPPFIPSIPHPPPSAHSGTLHNKCAYICANNKDAARDTRIGLTSLIPHTKFAQLCRKTSTHPPTHPKGGRSRRGVSRTPSIPPSPSPAPKLSSAASKEIRNGVVERLRSVSSSPCSAR